MSLEAELAQPTEKLVHAPVRKLLSHEYFRTHPQHVFTSMVYEDRQTRQYYFVAPKMIAALSAISEVSVVSLIPFYTRQKVYGILPLKIPTGATASTGWHETAMTAASMAKTQWVRMRADMALGAYRIFVAEGDITEPEWPDMPFNELLDVAFKNRVIDSVDHPIINKLMGRV